MESIGPPPGGDLNRANLLLGVTWSFTAVSTFLVTLRLYSRIRHLNRLWWDDLFIVLGEVRTTSLPTPQRVSLNTQPGAHDSIRHRHHHLRLRRRLPPSLLPIRSASLANLEAQLHLPGLCHHGIALLQGLHRLSHPTPPCSRKGAHGPARLLRQQPLAMVGFGHHFPLFTMQPARSAVQSVHRGEMLAQYVCQLYACACQLQCFLGSGIRCDRRFHRLATAIECPSKDQSKSVAKCWGNVSSTSRNHDHLWLLTCMTARRCVA